MTRLLRLFALPILLVAGWGTPDSASAAAMRVGASGPWGIFSDAEKGKCRMELSVGKIAIAVEYEPGTDTARLFTSNEDWAALPDLNSLNEGTDIDVDYDFDVVSYKKGAARVHKLGRNVLLHSALAGRMFLSEAHDAKSLRIARDGANLLSAELPGWTAALDAITVCANAVAKPSAPAK